MGTLRMALRFCGFALCCLWVIPSQNLVLLFTKGPHAYLLPLLWHKCICLIFGIRCEVIGIPCTDRQTLFVSNHLSYLDITAIGSVLKCSFVSKSEVANWPVFGFLSALQQTAFVQRKRTEAGKQKNALQSRITAGDPLIIFPEGTSTDGRNVLPFKSSLFSLALGDHNDRLYIQPITIQIVEVDGRPPRTQEDRDLYAWHRDMDTGLGDHLARFARSKGAKIRLTFHPPLKASDFKDRKMLAKTCHDTVSRGMELAHAA